MRAFLRRLGADALHLIAPALCPACDQPLEPDEHGYCRACRASLEPAPYPRDLFNDLVAHSSGEEVALDAIAALYRFEQESPVQRLLHALKYQGCAALGIELGRELGGALKLFPEFDGIDVVIPVPLHSARRRERGYNQAEMIALGVGASIGAAVSTTLLLRRRHTGSQTRLSAEARSRNVRGAFQVASAGIDRRIILLCDDVCTTGSTLNVCAEALRAAGARSVRAATVAKDDI